MATAWGTPSTSRIDVLLISVVAIAALWITILLRRVRSQTAHIACKLNEQNHAHLETEAANQAIRQFLSTFSHEIRTPINGVLGMTNILAEMPLSPAQEDCVATICASANGLLRVVNDTLDYSRIEAGQLLLEASVFDLHTTVEESAELMAGSTTAKDLQIYTIIDPAVPKYAVGDASRLRQVIVKLISYSLEATRDGVISVHVDLGPQSDSFDAERSLTASPDPISLRFSIRNTSACLDTQLLETVFSGNHRMLRKPHGPLLGLSIACRIVELMGGHIGASSNEQEGSTLWFTARVGSHIAEDPQRSTFVGKCALVISPSPAAQLALRSQLRYLGAEVVAAADLAEAQNYLCADRRCDVILLDEQASHKGARSVASELLLLQNGSHRPVILVAPMRTYAAFQSGSIPGIQASLLQPLRCAKLADALHQAIHASSSEIGHTPREMRTVVPERGLRILVAEDNPIDRKVILHHLRKLECAVDIVSTGVAAVEAVQMAPYDMVFMDCHMPEMDGYTATWLIRNLPNGIGRVPIVALATGAQQDECERCTAAGMDDYLAKPASHSEIALTLCRWLGERKTAAQTI